jgi:hypothetical protein
MGEYGTEEIGIMPFYAKIGNAEAMEHEHDGSIPEDLGQSRRDDSPAEGPQR